MALDGEYFVDKGGAGAGTWADPDDNIADGVAGTSDGDVITAKHSSAFSVTDVSLLRRALRTAFNRDSIGNGFQIPITVSAPTNYGLRMQERSSLNGFNFLNNNNKAGLELSGSDIYVGNCNFHTFGNDYPAIQMSTNIRGVLENLVIGRDGGASGGKFVTGDFSFLLSMIRNVSIQRVSGNLGLSQNTHVRNLYVGSDLTIDGDSATMCYVDGLMVDGDLTIDSTAYGIAKNVYASGSITNNSSNFSIESSGGISKTDVANALKDTDVSATSSVSGSVVDTLTSIGITRANSRLKELVYDANNNPTSYEEHFYPTAADAAADTNVSMKLLVQTSYTNNQITSRLIKDIT